MTCSNRMTIPIFAILASLAVAPIRAEEAAPAPVPVPKSLDEAAAQRAQATQLRTEADRLYETEQAGCYEKFLVNRCLDDARKRHTQSLIDARNLDTPARHFQEEAHRADVEAKEAQRAADAESREKDQQEKGETYRADEAQKAALREQKVADKAAQAEAGRQKMAADQAKYQARLQKHAQKIADAEAKRKKKEAKQKPAE